MFQIYSTSHYAHILVAVHMHHMDISACINAEFLMQGICRDRGGGQGALRDAAAARGRLDGGPPRQRRA